MEYYLKTSFRFLDEGKIGRIQHEILDLGLDQQTIMRRWKISPWLYSKIKRCIPSKFTKVSNIGWKNERSPNSLKAVQ